MTGATAGVGEGDNALAFFVPGSPAAQGSKEYMGHRGGRPIMLESARKKLTPWRETVAMAARSNADGLIPAPAGVRLQFVMPRPKSTPKTKTPPAIKRTGDIDKLTRGVLDALTGTALVDDAHVIDVRATKRIAAIGEPPGCHITIWPIRWNEQQNREGES